MPFPICRHVKTNGLQCGSPALAGQLYCFFHHRMLQRHVAFRRVSTAPALIPGQHLQLSALEDRDAIQVNISVVINALATGQLETKRAMAILYGLQLASSNVARMELPPSPMRVVRQAESTPDGLDLAAPGAVLDPSEPHLFNHMDDVDPSDLDLEEETARWQSDGLIRFTTGTQEDAGERAQSPHLFEHEELDDLEEPPLPLDPPPSPLPGVNCHQTAQEPTQMSTLLEQLRSMTTVVADSGDINSIQKYKPQDSTTNPSLIAAAAAQPEYQSIVDDVLKTAKQDAGSSASDKDVAALAFKTLAVAFGRKILDIVPGRVSTEVDARLSYDTEKTIEQAKDIIGQYDKAGISRERVLIKIASTWEGIQAAEQLEKQGIHCNLTLLFGLHQAIACAEAKVTLISPFVGRILDWYKKDTGKDYTGADDPGVQSVTTIYNYYKKFDYKTVVMGASFRNIGEITELAGCDLLTIAPKLLEELSTTQADLPRKLDPAKSKSMDIQKIPMDKATFDKMHAEDRMAHDKLKEGIEGFSKALEDLEKLLEKRLAELDK